MGAPAPEKARVDAQVSAPIFRVVSTYDLEDLHHRSNLVLVRDIHTLADLVGKTFGQ